MSSTLEFIFSALICALGLSIAGAYFLLRRWLSQGGLAWWDRIDTPEGVRIRAHRRNLGMAIVAVVSGATFLGINHMDPMSFPVQFVYYWLIMLLLVFWLCVLGLADIRHTLRVHRNWRRRHSDASLERYLQVYHEAHPVRQYRGDPK